MHVVCLDLEGVLVPEIWIEFAKATGIDELKITTRDESDYDKLMKYRIDILDRKGLKLNDIQKVIGGMEPLIGAKEFLNELRSLSQVVILSDTFTQFAKPLMSKLGYPTLFCNSLLIGPDDSVIGYSLRQLDGKLKAVTAFQSMNLNVFAAGDSYNDLGMIKNAHDGALFSAPANIKKDNPEIPSFDTYSDLLSCIKSFLNKPF